MKKMKQEGLTASVGPTGKTTVRSDSMMNPLIWAMVESVAVSINHMNSIEKVRVSNGTGALREGRDSVVVRPTISYRPNP
jgi:hypothetical protein